MNEVGIKVTSEDATDGGFSSARRKASSFVDDVGKLLSKSGDKGGQDFAFSFVGKAGPLLAKGPLSPPLLAGLAVAAPAVSSILAGAVTAGVGAGAVAAGLAIASKDPRVQGAATELKAIIGNNLTGIAEKTFVPETLAALSHVKAEFGTVRPQLESIFSDSARYVEPLTKAATGFARELLPGIASAVGRAEPLFDMLEDRVPRIGAAVGQVVDDFSRSAAQSADTIGGVLTLVEATLLTTGKAMGFLSEQSSLLGLGPLQLLGDIVSDGDQKTGDWANTFGDLRAAIEQTNASAMSYADTIRAQTDPTFAMIKAQKDLKEAQGDYNKALRDHGKNSAEAQEALLELGQAAIQAQIAAQGVAGEFNGELTPSMRATLKAAGLTAAQIDQLEKQFRQAKSAGDAYAKTYRAKVVTEYIGRPFSDFTGIGGSTNRGYAHGGIASAATGGTRSGLVEVGEHGRELVKLPPGAHVMSNPDTERMLAGAGPMGGWAGGVIEVRPAPGADVDLMNAIVKGLRFTIRTEGQGDPQTYLSGA